MCRPTAQYAAADHRIITALLIPPAEALPVAVVRVPDSARGISSILGGCLVDDEITGVLDGQRYVVYIPDGDGAQGQPAGLPDNPRAAVLAARLGHVDRAVQRRIRGYVLVAGLRPTSDDDTDVPAGVIEVARRSGIAVAPAQTRGMTNSVGGTP